MNAICSACGSTAPSGTPYSCPLCGGALLLQYERPDGNWNKGARQGIWKYAALLPNVPASSRIELGEGGTPLVRSVSLGKRLGIEQLYFKYEGGNPTGSYKDRIAAMGVSWALAQGKAACIGTSSGNAGAAAAAYAARAKLPYHLFVLENMAEAKLAQVLAYGADVRKVVGFGYSPEVGEEVFDRVVAASKEHNWEIMVTAFRFNPYAMEGVKTIAYEIAEQLGEAAAARVYSPAGGGGLYVGIWKGFDELSRLGLATGKPHMVAVQPDGCSNIARAYKLGEKHPAPGPATSRISGLQVPNPPDGEAALALMAAGDGSSVSVADGDIYTAQRMLAEEEGIFCEPAGATALAGLIRERDNGRTFDSGPVVCIVSGVGFKDGASVEEMVKDRDVPLLEAAALGI
ncbi:threonine synthase [Cohnella fermenti]|uniref:Pyridoxal-phosphate dependent enzyme n=1 Tax=Cohnella fermenti TaxID=2565925 RepID=A0A4S4BQT9_9BACL|nr:pyridoxal-phosphate dependent enzyme [Cohnella fermenti]THF77314.1 pyridoxal-phosphate dependent enzyme [Cohnella fermenti]